MSNVLIGIIGVILFIGLALAGALFLGPRFQESTANSDAAAVMSSIKQAIDGAELWRIQEGRSYVPASGAGFLAPGYLKSIPSNPAPAARGNTMPSAYYWSVHFDNNIHLYDAPEPGYAAKFAIAVIGPESDARAKTICQTISRSYGTPIIPDFSKNSDPQPTTEAGCFLGYRLASTDAEPTAAYVAYEKMASSSQSLVQPSGL
jgi:hypothetical protein